MASDGLTSAGATLEQRAERQRLLGLVPVLALIGLLFMVPLFVLGRYAFFTPDFDLGAFERILTTTAYLRVLLFSAKVSLYVTVICAIIGYAIALLLLVSSDFVKRMLLLAVILPYFTSTLVRTYSWMLLLGSNGLINTTLMRLGLTERPIQFMYNELGVVIGMSYVMIPYMTLTVYANLKAIDQRVIQASFSLGASALYTFWRVILPLSVPAIVAGVLLVYLLSIGFYVTPALMGGTSNVMIGVLIAQELEVAGNWSMASALSIVLLAAALVIFAVYSRVLKISSMFGVEK